MQRVTSAMVREQVGVVALYALLTIAATWPLITHLDVAVADPGDPFINAWTIDWVQHALLSDAEMFDANIFHPHPNTLAFSEHLFGLAVVSLPLRALGFGPLAIHNVLLLLSFPLLGWATYLAARVSSASRGAAFLAGMLALLLPWRITHLTHLQDLWSFTLPLLFASVVHLTKTPTPRSIVLFAVAFLLNGVGNLHWLAFGGLAAVLSLMLAAGSGTIRWRSVAMSLGAAGVISVALLPLLLPYQSIMRTHGVRADTNETLGYSATPSDWFLPHIGSRFWGRFNDGTVDPERWLFPGATLLLLASVGGFELARRRRSVRHDPVFDTIIIWASCGLIGSLGLHAPFHGLLSLLPGFSGIRVPARWMAIAHVALAVAAAIGTDTLIRRRAPRVRHAILIGFLAVGLVEVFPPPIGWHLIDDGTPDLVRWLSSLDRRPVIVELPVRQREEYEYMLRSTAHHLPTLNGTSGAEPQSHASLRTMFATTPIPAGFLHFLAQSGTSLIVVHADQLGDRSAAVREWLATELRRGRLTLIDAFHANIERDFVFALRDPLSFPKSRDFARASKDLARFLENEPASILGPTLFLSSPVHHTLVGTLEIRGWAISDVPLVSIDVTLGTWRKDVEVERFADHAINDRFRLPPQTLSGFRATVAERPRFASRSSNVRVEIVGGNGREQKLPPTPFHWMVASD